MSALEARLRAAIADEGSIGLDRFMAAAALDPEGGHYQRGAPIGGDFLTAPEISPLFGEMIAVALIDYWRRGGAPGRAHLVEIGGGRGALMADLLRAARIAPDFLEAATLHLIEPSDALRARQEARLAQHEPRMARDAAALDALEPAPVFVIANEVLDAMPVERFVARAEGWREQRIGLDQAGAFAWVDGPIADTTDLPDAPGAGAVHERSPARSALIDRCARLVAARGGAALFFDYGAAIGDRPTGDSLQALAHHRAADPLARPGAADLSCHVNFGAIARAARDAGAAVAGPVPQARFLRGVGLEARLAMLLRKRPGAAGRELAARARRLVDPAQMGVLFQALAILAPGAPPPAGFEGALP